VNSNIKKSVTNIIFFVAAQNMWCNEYDTNICQVFSLSLK